MGATNFSNIGSARSASEAYQSLVKEARDYFGGRSYTGSIAETRGFKMVGLREGESLAACEERVLDAACRDDWAAGAKWGAAACVDLGPDPEAPGLRRFAFFGWAAC